MGSFGGLAAVPVSLAARAAFTALCLCWALARAAVPVAGARASAATTLSRASALTPAWASSPAVAWRLFILVVGAEANVVDEVAVKALLAVAF